MAGVRLIDLQTDLKSLRYGNDKPYVTKDINSPTNSNQTGMQINKRVDDVSRIAQMLVDRPGLKFIGNQALLQQVDLQDKLQKSRDKGKTFVGALLKQEVNTVVQTAKILGSTLAQVPVNGTGTHFVYAFRTDTYLQPSGGSNRSAFAQFFGAGGVEGAPLALRGKSINGVVESNFGESNQQTGEFKITAESELDYDEYFNKPRTDNTAKVEAQAGNPIKVQEGSVETTITPGTIGISNQKIIGTVSGREAVVKPFSEVDQESVKKSKNSTEQNILNALTGSIIPLKRETPDAKDTTETTGTLGISNQTIDTGSIKPEGSFNTKVEDFRRVQGNSYSFDYNAPKINKETRINLGNQGKVTFDRSNYGNSSDTDTHDKLNKLNESGTRIDGTADARDLAKFYFEIITPESNQFLHFRAFIDSIDDSYNADWQGFKYVGRAENFYTYGGFERDINISFKIAAATRAEMKPLYRKMVLLASATAPTYGGQGFMRGTLARITVGSYFSQIPGVLTSVKYNLIQDMPWEISMQNPEAGTDDDMQELPMGLQCSVSFKVIHDFAPQTGLYHYFTSPNPLNGSTSFLK